MVTSLRPADWLAGWLARPTVAGWDRDGDVWWISIVSGLVFLREFSVIREYSRTL